MLACRMENFNRNRFRLQTQGSSTATPNGTIITVNLPENSVIDLKSLRMFMNVACTNSGQDTSTPTNEVFSKFGNSGCFISGLEVYCNGILVQHKAAEYNTIYRMLQISQSHLDWDASVEKSLYRSYIGDGPVSSGASYFNDVGTLCCYWWPGFISENATQYLSTELLGSIQLRITISDTSVLVPQQQGQAIGAAFTSPIAAANAALISFNISDIYFTLDTIIPSPEYNMLLREQLMSHGELALNYKERYSYTLDSIPISSGTASMASANRFSLSSGSIDRIYGVFRDSSYRQPGVPAYQLVDSVGETYVSNAVRFRAYDVASGDTTDTPLYKARFYTQVNNVSYPNYQKNVLECLADVAHSEDKLDPKDDGNLVFSQSSFVDGLFQCNTLLNCPTRELGVSLKSGYNSKGINTQMVFNALNQTGYAAGTVQDPRQSTTCQSFVVSEATQSVIVGLGKMIAISY